MARLAAGTGMSSTQGGGRTPQRQRVSRWALVFPPEGEQRGPWQEEDRAEGLAV